MRKLLLCLFIAFTTVIIWDSCNQDAHTFTSGSPGSYSGSPSDGNKTCGSCHGGNNAPATVPGLITSDIPNDGYVPGSTYTLTITGDFQGRIEYGFELSVNNSTGTNIGGLIHTTGSTKTVNAKSATHTSTGINAPSGSRTWTMNWTAPPAGTGTVTFYVAVNATNNNGGNSGDVVLKSTLSASEKLDPCVINDVDVSASNPQLCTTASTNILVANSQSGISYQLKNASTNANVGTAQSGTGSILSFNTGNLTSTTTFKVLATRDANCSFTLTDQPTVTVSNDPVPTITPSGPTTFCKGDSIVLTSSLAQAYTWNTGQTSRSITVKNAGNYTVVVDYASGCTVSSAPLFVNVNPLPEPALNFKGAVGICDGDSVVLSTGTFSSYTWSNGKTTKDIVVKTSGTYTVQVTNSAGCKGKSLDTAFVTVGAKPSAEISVLGSRTICEGDSVRLSVPGGSVYQWSNGGTSNTIVVKTTGDYSVVVGSGACLAKSDTVHIEQRIVKTPVLNFSGTVQLCLGDSILLSPDTVYDNYQWSNGDITQTTVIRNPGTYQLTVSDDFGCSKTTAIVNVIAGTKLNPILKASGPLTICPGKTLQLSTGVFNSYMWSNGSTDTAITVTEAGKYFVTVTSQSGCSGTSDTVTVKVEPAPTVSLNVSGFIIGCDSIMLEATAGNATYNWNNGKTGRRIYVKVDGLYYVNVTSVGGCEARSDSAIVLVGKKPNANITLTAGVFTSSEQYGNQWYRSGELLIGDTNRTLALGPIDGDYYTIVIDEKGVCSDTSNVIKINRTGISEVDRELVSLYPNPAKEKLFISFNNSSFVQLKIFNLLGEQIQAFDQIYSPMVLDISNLVQGNYILSIAFPEQIVTKRFTVHHND